MTIEIWSDIVCPFCYIGKRRFEAALKQFGQADIVTVVWRSFQLDPHLKTEPHKSVAQSLCEKKGWTMAQTQQTMAHVVNMAQSVGLHYNFDKAVVANSFDAHRFIHFAKTVDKQDAAKESLLKAYFIDGKNTADHDTLVEIAQTIGLNGTAITQMLNNDDFADAVRTDIQLAQQFGITGVPFFVFNRQYAVSGAQDVQVFVETLEKSSKNPV
jgi:predicted DsbA family dithiol-disulfide isomerase